MASDLGLFWFEDSCEVQVSLVIASRIALEAGSSVLSSAVSIFSIWVGGGGGGLCITLWEVFFYHGRVYGDYLIHS